MPPTKRKQWEYEAVEYPSLKCFGMGNEGWELCAIRENVHWETYGKTVTLFYFKREKLDAAD